VSVTLKGSDRTYTIDCTRVNTLVALEETTGLTLASLVNALDSDDPDPDLAKQFLAAVLIDPDDVSADELAAILDDIGGPAVIAAAASGVT
jgi:hypothetical protein